MLKDASRADHGHLVALELVSGNLYMQENLIFNSFYQKKEL
jgi:hypothetical protein